MIYEIIYTYIYITLCNTIRLNSNIRTSFDKVWGQICPGSGIWDHSWENDLLGDILELNGLKQS